MRVDLRSLLAPVTLIVCMAPLVLQGQQPASKPASAPPEPTPRLVDGTPNLGRVPGEKGVWDVPYIQNMADYATGRSEGPRAAAAGGRLRDARPGRCGAMADDR